jgi:hypothetical protein
MLRPGRSRFNGLLELIAGGLIILPAHNNTSEVISTTNVTYLTLGASGSPLREGLKHLKEKILVLLEAGAKG